MAVLPPKIFEGIYFVSNLVYLVMKLLLKGIITSINAELPRYHLSASLQIRLHYFYYSAFQCGYEKHI